MPINAGWHWSLLAYDGPTNEFVHVDSMGPHTHHAHLARRLSERLALAMGGYANERAQAARFVVIEVPPSERQQQAECGVYVAAYGDMVVRAPLGSSLTAALGGNTPPRLRAFHASTFTDFWTSCTPGTLRVVLARVLDELTCERIQ
jgi:Ulp1 family protease